MTTATYQCPMCGRKMDRNLVLFLDHTEQHVIDQIKKEHPEWVEADGVCQPCTQYYRKQLSGESSEENIGPRGRRNRFWLGIVTLVLTSGWAFFLKWTGANRIWSLLLFLPLFGGMLGLIQARQKTCALLAERGLRDMDTGKGKIADTAIATRLRIRGRSILLKSALGAAVLTALLLLI